MCQIIISIIIIGFVIIASSSSLCQIIIKIIIIGFVIIASSSSLDNGEKTTFFLLFLFIVWMAALLYDSITNKRQKARAKAEAEEKERYDNQLKREKYLSVLKASEPVPDLITIPSTQEFDNEEEKMINEQFRDFLKCKNEIIKLETSIEYLKTKGNALSELSLNDEAEKCKENIKKKEDELRECKASLCSKRYNSDLHKIFYGDKDVAAEYEQFCNLFDKVKVDPLHYTDKEAPAIIVEFFHEPGIKILRGNDNIITILTAAYITIYKKDEKILKVSDYLRMSAFVFTEYPFYDVRLAVKP